MNQIGAIIDFDGFRIGKVFAPREIGLIGLREACPSIMTIDLREEYPNQKLTEKNWKHIRFCSKFLHGLTFYPKPFEKCIPLANVDTQILKFYNSTCSAYQPYLAYKGGDVERERLEILNIPSINLEDFGCPKVEDLIFGKNFLCPSHKNSEVYHCAGYEVFRFREWLKRQLDQSYIEAPFSYTCFRNFS